MYKLCCSRHNPLKLIHLLLYNLTLLNFSCHIWKLCDSESIRVREDKNVWRQHIYFWFNKLVLTMTWKLISHIEKLLPQRLNDDLIDHSMFSWKVKNILYCISTVERIFDSIVYYSSWNWSRKVGLTLKLTIDFVKGGFFRGSHFVVALRKLPMETDCSIKPTQANSVLLTHFGRKKISELFEQCS